METQRLTASHVKIGVPLPGDIYDETQHLLLSAGFVITDPSMLKTLLARGMYVDLRTFKLAYESPEPAAQAVERKFDPFQVRDSLKKRLNRTLRSLHDIKDAGEQIAGLAATIRSLTTADAEGAIAAGILDQDESYAIRHSVQSAILCDLIVATLGWPDDQRSSVVGAALTMNAAMIDLQDRLAGQNTPLTPQQREAVEAHPAAACELLRQAGIDDPEWLAAVGQHHARRGGEGYPAHVEPGQTALMLHVVDAFGALIVARGDRRMLPPPQAIQTVFAQESEGPAKAFAGALVKVLGVFPPGTFVKLANNETAVVHRHGRAANLPLVASVTSHAGNPFMKPLPRDTWHKDFAIKTLVTRDKVSMGYDLAMLWVTAAKS